MDETIFPPAPSWFLPNILVSREDGSIAYGSLTSLVILKTVDKSFTTSVIKSAHNLKITSVAFSPSNCDESLQNTVASCAEDGFVKLWKIDTLLPLLGHKSHWEPKGAVVKIICLDWSKANPHHIVSAAENNTLVLWNVLSNSTQKFSYPKLGATVIACCPYNEKIVAAGSKFGLIFIINLTQNGDIVYKLRGHDNEIQSVTWCPIPYNIFKQNDLYEEFLLASGCQDKEIYIWRAGSDGKCEIKIQTPTSCISKKDDQPHVKIGNNFSFLTLFWFDPYTIYLSSNFGELLYFDIKSYLTNKSSDDSNSAQKKNKKKLNSFKLVHSFHSKRLFAIAGTPRQGELMVNESTAVKSELKFKIESNNITITENLNNENEGNKFKWEVMVPNESSLVWTAGQDKKIVACKPESSGVEMVFNLHTMNGSVYCAVVSPHDPNRIAIAVGDGMIRLWNLTEPSGNVQIFWQKIKDRVMSLAWHPTKDGLLAYGTSEGRVGLIDTNSNKLPYVFKPSHPQPVYNLSWGPEFSPDPLKDDTKSEFGLYSVGNNKLWVYNCSNLSADPINLSKILPFKCDKQTDVSWKPDYSLMAVGNEDGSICLLEPLEFKIVHTLLAYKKLIESIAWHPASTSLDSDISPYHGYFTSGSTDNENEIRVFNCKREENEIVVEKVATLKGHHGHIQSVSWCPHVGGRLISTSADGSVQIWDVITQTPLTNYTPVGLPLFSVWSPLDSDVILTGCKNSVLCLWKISSQTKTTPSSQAKMKKNKSKNNHIGMAKETVEKISETPETTIENGIAVEAMAGEKKTSKNSKEFKMFLKAWKVDGNDELSVCYSLLKNENRKENSAHYSLPFLGSDNTFKELMKAEEESYKKTNSWNEYYELSLWNGNIMETIEEKIKTGQLNDFLVSLAPVISPRVWKEACLAYSKTLAEKKLFRKAASYLVVVHKVYEAIELLIDANLFLEALCIAKSRLPESDPMINKVVQQYAHWLFKNGALLKACECYIYLEDYKKVAKIFGKKSQPEYLSLAALAAKKIGDEKLESLEATNAMLKCIETSNFGLANIVSVDHPCLKHLALMYNTHHTINLLETGSLILKKDIISHIKEITEVDAVVLPKSLEQTYHKYVLYKNKPRMYLVVGQELLFAICSKEMEKILVHLIKALSTCCRFVQTIKNEVHPLYKVCNWLSPLGCLTENSYFTLKESRLMPKVKSLRAFLCAAIIRNLNDNPVPDDIIKRLDILSELKDDLLDKEGYEYYKNLIEVELCEKRILRNRNRVSRIKVNDIVQRSCTHSSDSFYSPELKISPVREDEINGFSAPEENKEVNSDELQNSELLKNVEEENMKEGEINFVYSFKDGDAKDLKESYDSEEQIIQDTELLSKLKANIENFESIRISTPNPVPVYFMLKKLCEAIPENESAKILLQNIEIIWRGLM